MSGSAAWERAAECEALRQKYEGLREEMRGAAVYLAQFVSDWHAAGVALEPGERADLSGRVEVFNERAVQCNDARSAWYAAVDQLRADLPVTDEADQGAAAI